VGVRTEFGSREEQQMKAKCPVRCHSCKITCCGVLLCHQHITAGEGQRGPMRTAAAAAAAAVLCCKLLRPHPVRLLSSLNSLCCTADHCSLRATSSAANSARSRRPAEFAAVSACMIPLFDASAQRTSRVPQGRGRALSTAAACRRSPYGPPPTHTPSCCFFQLLPCRAVVHMPEDMYSCPFPA